MNSGLPPPPAPSRVFGRYALFGRLAVGGMAMVHLGRLLGQVGFARTVAIKQLLPQFASDPDFVTMFLDETRIAARVRHPNVVATLDVVVDGEEIFLVMDYVEGETLSRLLRTATERQQLLAPAMAVNVVLGALAGLHAAHEATTEQGSPLHLVHRDISPQNVMVGVDGTARVLDFGVAKAVGRAQHTREGEVKGKIAYMAPEQIRGGVIDRRADIYAASVMLWEALTLQRLFRGDTDAERMYQVLQSTPDPPSLHAPDVSPALDAVVLRGLAALPEDRFATAAEMALALEKAVPILPAREVGAWVTDLASASLTRRSNLVEEIERSAVPTLSPSLRPLPLEDPDSITREMDQPTDAASTSTLRTVPTWSSRLPLALGGAGLLGLGALLATQYNAPAADPAIDHGVVVASSPAVAAAPPIESAAAPATSASAPVISVSAADAGDGAAATKSSSRSGVTAAPTRKPSLEHRPLYKRE